MAFAVGEERESESMSEVAWLRGDSSHINQSMDAFAVDTVVMGDHRT